MKKIITAIILASVMLLATVSCGAKTVDISDATMVKINYSHEGTTVNAEIAVENAGVIVNNVHGQKITKNAPEEAEFVDGVYFEISNIKFYIDLNGGEALKVNDEGYIYVEKYKLDAMMSVFQTYGINPIK